MARSIHQRRSSRQERSTAEDLGGRVQKGSGSSDFAKSDVRADGVRAECKTTSARSYSLKLAEWRKIVGEARQSGDQPVMQIQFQGDAGIHTNLAVLDWETYLYFRKNENTGKNPEGYCGDCGAPLNDAGACTREDGK